VAWPAGKARARSATPSSTTTSGPLHDHVIKPVIDLAHQAPVDACELPDRLREAVHLMAPWTVRQPFTGIYLWRDPHGRLYLHDHTGTHPIGAARTFDPDLDLYPAENVITVDFPRQA
jgi:hypothetical protein